MIHETRIQNDKRISSGYIFLDQSTVCNSSSYIHAPLDNVFWSPWSVCWSLSLSLPFNHHHHHHRHDHQVKSLTLKKKMMFSQGFSKRRRIKIISVNPTLVLRDLGRDDLHLICHESHSLVRFCLNHWRWGSEEDSDDDEDHQHDVWFNDHLPENVSLFG